MTSNTNNHIINIVLLTDCLSDLTGGAEKQIYELTKGLNKEFYKVFIVTLDECGETPRSFITSVGGKILEYKLERIYSIDGMIKGVGFFLFLKKYKIDILLTYHFGSDVWGTFWGHLAGVRTIISNRRDMGFWRNNLHILAYKFINRWVNKIIVVSSSIKDMIIHKEGYPSGRIEVIYNGVEFTKQLVKDLSTIRRSLEINDNEIVIVHVANLKPVKGHKYLLEAFASLCHQHPDLKLLLVGRDDLNGELQSMARRFGVLGKTLFLGQRKDVADLLAIADICVLPSLSEGMSNAVLEYMSAGKPVIATKVGGNPELIQDGFNGLLVEKENYKQLENALQILINDPGKRTLMGSNGQARVRQEFSLPTMIERYETVFHEIKVLHLISSGGLFGAERVILNLASIRNGVHAIVGAIHNDHNPHLEIIEHASRQGIDTVTFPSNGKLDLKTIQSVKKFIQHNAIKVLHTHNYKSDLIGFSAAQGTGAKWIATQHGWINTDQKLKLYENLDARILKFAMKVIVVTQENLDKLKNNNFKKDRVALVDNGIPIGKFQADRNALIRAQFNLAPNDIGILIVGRLAEEKGHEIFLKAAAQAVKKTANAKFIIVGDGALRQQLEQLVNELKLAPYVGFTGIREDMPAVYASCDILVNASYIEGLPMTILEAMASRLAVIATNVGAVPNVIQDQKNGILIKPGDIDALTAAILQLVEDQNKREQLGQNACDTVCAHYSDALMAEKYKNIYKECIN